MNEVTVSSACKYLGVSTSGYYAWRKRQANTAKKYNDLKAVYWQHHARLGAPSLVHDMHDLGYSMSERTVGRMLKNLVYAAGLHVNTSIRLIQTIVCLQHPICWRASIYSHSA
jgi:hypothetical protein